jgi:hypothetical protein
MHLHPKESLGEVHLQQRYFHPTPLEPEHYDQISKVDPHSLSVCQIHWKTQEAIYFHGSS